MGTGSHKHQTSHRPLYTAEQRRRRDASRWTLVQGVLAPLQFLVCLVSIALIHHWFATGEHLAWATGSVVVKTALLFAIMITGALWEHDVFGRYLFARPFFWEDVVSMAVILLHVAFLAAWLTGSMTGRDLLWLALTAYAVYIVNAVQFLLKLRAARLSAPAAPAAPATEAVR